MTTSELCAVAAAMARHADRVARVDELVTALEQCVLAVYKGVDVDDGGSRRTAHKTMTHADDDRHSDDDDNDNDNDAAHCSRSSSSSHCQRGASALASRDEDKLLLADAVAQLHTRGAHNTAAVALFRSAAYHPHASLFLHELLQSLTGNSQHWYRQLQLASLRACAAVLRVVGVANVRRCVPGVVSITSRYIARAQHGKDAAVVRVAAIELLQLALCLALAGDGNDGDGDEAAWLHATMPRLAGVLHRILDATALVRGDYSHAAATALQRCVVQLLRSSSVWRCGDTALSRQLLVAYAVLASMTHLQQQQHDDKQTCVLLQRPPLTTTLHEADNDDNATMTLSGDVLRHYGASRVLRRALQLQLRGVSLLHVAMTVLRTRALRALLVALPTQRQCRDGASDGTVADGAQHNTTTTTTTSTVVACDNNGDTTTSLLAMLRVRDDDDDDDGDDDKAASSAAATLCTSVLLRCIRVCTTDVASEALYTHRTPRPYPCGVVDEYLQCLAYTLATQSTVQHDDNKDNNDNNDDDDDVAVTAGEYVTSRLMDVCETVLRAWELYALHPATIYVLARVVLWQFAPASSRSSSGNDNNDDNNNSSSSGHASAALPHPSQLITSSAFEQLWSLLGAAHLWHITADAARCTRAQMQHRCVVVATTLRSLALAASDVMAHCARDSSHDTSHVDNDDNSGGSDDDALATTSRHSVRRFVTLTVYLLLEKATCEHSIVQTAALHALSALADVAAAATAAPRDDNVDADAAALSPRVAFVASVGDLLVDEATRAVHVDFLRVSAMRVLHGAMIVLLHDLQAPQPRRRQEQQQQQQQHAQDDVIVNDDDEAADCAAATSLQSLVRQRLSCAVASQPQQQQQQQHSNTVVAMTSTALSPSRVAPLADFVAASARIAAQCCRCCYAQPRADDEDDDMRAALTLLRDAADVAMYVCAAVPLATHNDKSNGSSHNDDDDDEERPTTSAHPRVQQMQLALLEALEQVLLCCSGGSAATARPPLAVQAVVRTLTVFLTPPQTTATTAAITATTTQTRVLPRALLKVVYKVYLSFVAMLREPVASFGVPLRRVRHDGSSSSSSSAVRRSAHEQRALAAVAVTPATFAALAGLECLLLLCRDFLVARYVDEVLPVVLLWHECSSGGSSSNNSVATRLRVRTHTHARLAHATRSFAQSLLRACDTTATAQRRAVRRACAPFFALPSDHDSDTSDHDDGSSNTDTTAA